MVQRAVSYDHGGNKRGRGGLAKGNVEKWQCLYCGAQQVQPKAQRHRAGHVRCHECSGIMQPMTAHRTKGPKKSRGAATRPKTRACRRGECKTQLPRNHDIGYCNDCFNAMSVTRRSSVLQKGNPKSSR